MSEDERGKPNIAIGRFWTEYEPVDGGQTVKEYDYAEIFKRGTTSSVVNRIARWKRENPLIWSIIEPAYNAWKKGESEIPPDGTPLEAWPAITSKGMIDHMKSLKIATVEHLALATSADADRIGMGAVRLIALAKAFVETKKGSSAVSAALAERDQRIERQQQEIDDLKRTVEQLAAAVPKKGPAKLSLTPNTPPSELN